MLNNCSQFGACLPFLEHHPHDQQMTFFILTHQVHFKIIMVPVDSMLTDTVKMKLNQMITASIILNPAVVMDNLGIP